MFAENTEAAETAYAHAQLSQLDNQLDNENLVSMEPTDSGLVKQPALQKLKALAVAMRDDRFWQAFKTIAKSFPEGIFDQPFREATSSSHTPRSHAQTNQHSLAAI